MKRPQEGLVVNYTARLFAQGFSQIPGVHCVFASAARFVVVRTGIALAASEDLEAQSVDILTAFLNGAIDNRVYMGILDGFEVEGEPLDGEDTKRWVVRLTKGLDGTKPGPRLWVLKFHFQQIDCDYSAEAT